MKKLVLLGLLATLFVAFPALADIGTIPQISMTAIGILDAIGIITGWFALLIFALAVIFILYAAFLFITAGGNDEQVKKAKNTLLWGVVGIIVALLAYGAVELIVSFIE